MQNNKIDNIEAAILAYNIPESHRLRVYMIMLNI